MPVTAAGTITVRHATKIHQSGFAEIPHSRFDHRRNVYDIDTSIAGEPNPALRRYKVAPIAIETNRWRWT
ncbi:hypothetical protein JQ607_17240 [Bradyrhizobium liaoningense]|uniref:hypothetical protein n=1 Tax=Bradyrhizobium liaoningense TaxID=43992 RepID=UPI001BA9F080|nr:hypothetical protein [Bradyrhizobium liaoningense]MBR0841945.1 hypothetical protein [Bradyrhizobium liaoningense]